MSVPTLLDSIAKRCFPEKCREVINHVSTAVKLPVKFFLPSSLVKQEPFLPKVQKIS
jgi:hypothetical protein